ncbi:MAG: hypothetical protein WDO56_34065 [Gammaproteobacteria bacterium]
MSDAHDVLVEARQRFDVFASQLGQRSGWIGVIDAIAAGVDIYFIQGLVRRSLVLGRQCLGWRGAM